MSRLVASWNAIEQVLLDDKIHEASTPKVRRKATILWVELKKIRGVLLFLADIGPLISTVPISTVPISGGGIHDTPCDYCAQLSDDDPPCDCVRAEQTLIKQS